MVDTNGNTRWIDVDTWRVATDYPCFESMRRYRQLLAESLGMFLLSPRNGSTYVMSFIEALRSSSLSEAEKIDFFQSLLF